MFWKAHNYVVKPHRTGSRHYDVLHMFSLALPRTLKGACVFTQDISRLLYSQLRTPAERRLNPAWYCLEVRHSGRAYTRTTTTSSHDALSHDMLQLSRDIDTTERPHT